MRNCKVQVQKKNVKIKIDHINYIFVSGGCRFGIQFVGQRGGQWWWWRYYRWNDGHHRWLHVWWGLAIVSGQEYLNPIYSQRATLWLIHTERPIFLSRTQWISMASFSVKTVSFTENETQTIDMHWNLLSVVFATISVNMNEALNISRIANSRNYGNYVAFLMKNWPFCRQYYAK